MDECIGQEVEATSVDVQTVLEEKTHAVVKAIDELAAALTTEGLFGLLEELNDPLEKEWDEQEAKGITLLESHAQLKPRVEAQVRILAGEVDKAFAEGRDGDAEAKKQEIAELEANLQDILTQADACNPRMEEIVEQQQENYRLVFEEMYPAIRQSTVDVEIALVRLLDKVWTDLQRYGQESGITGRNGSPFVSVKHKFNLTPNEFGAEKVWLERLQRWFGGRR